MKYPQRPFTHQLEEISERFFISSLPKNWRCEKPGGDYGVDLKVDIFEGDNAIGLELLVQLKSSIKSSDITFEKIRVDTSTYNYLWDKLQVVMLVKYVESKKEAYWLLLSEVPEPNQKQKTFTIRIPKKNKLSTINWNEIKSYVQNVTRKKISKRERFIFRKK